MAAPAASQQPAPSAALAVFDSFVNDGHTYTIRVIPKPDDPERVLFSAADVAAALGISEVRSSIRDFEDDEKAVHQMHTPGGLQDVLFLTELGLYQLVFASRKPVAKKVQAMGCDRHRDDSEDWPVRA
jgi:prophage antirepressor-like protein